MAFILREYRIKKGHPFPGKSIFVKDFIIIFALLLGCFFFLFPERSLSQPTQYISRNWTPEDGLPSNVVNNIFQSRKGYIWISTYSGLTRFNGSNFQSFKPKGFPSLANAKFGDIIEDKEGNLWLGSETPHLVRISGNSDSTEVIDVRHQGDNNSIYSVLEDSFGRILFSTQYGVFLKTSNGIEKLTDRYHSSQLYQDSADNIYLVMQNKIGFWANGNIDREPRLFADKIDLKRFRVQNQTINNTAGQGRLIFREIRQLPDNKKLLYTSAGFLVFSENSYKWTPLDQLGIKSGNKVFVQGNKLWLTSRHGTYNLQVNGYEISNVQKITDTNDNAVFRGSEGTIWIGTANEGIRQLIPSPFKIYAKSDGLASNAILATLEDSRGWLWVGTNCEGLNRITANENKLFDASEGMASECVWSLVETHDGRIWASDRSVVFYDPKTDQFEPAPFNSQLKSSRYRALFSDSSQNLWLGTLGQGIARWDGKQLQYFTTDDGLPSNKIRMFYEDGKQTLWLATEKGIAKITDTDHPNPQKIEAAGDSYYRAIMRDQRGLFWFGSYGDGIIIFNKATGDTTRITTHTGLHENMISQIAEDEQGNIWLGGNKGIYVIPAKSIDLFLEGQSSTINTIAYGTDDGLRTAETAGGFQPSWQHTSDGKILFSTINGLVEIDPSAFKKNENTPPVYLEKVRVNNTTVPKTNPLTFSYDDRRIQFHFSVLSFKNPDEIEVIYRMKGFDDQWQQARTDRVITYTSLPPGNYTFEVQAANAYGVWNKNGMSLSVSVEAPFWQKGWFLLLSIVVVGGFLYGAFRLRIIYLRNRSLELEQQVRKRTKDLEREKQVVEEKNQVIASQNQKLEELNRMKDRFITGISHEFRTPLTLIFGSLEMAEEKLKASDIKEIEGYLDSIGRHSEKLRNLVDQFLELSKLEAGMSIMHKSTICLTKFSAGITSAFTSLAEQKEIDYRVHLPDDTVWIEADHPKLEMAINNILKNAFKFTGKKGTISYSLNPNPENERVFISISDTGKGIDTEDQSQIFDRFYQVEDESSTAVEGTGIGLAVSKEIIELHDGEISLDSKKGEGSTFKIVLPMLDLNLTPGESQLLLDKMFADDSHVSDNTEPVSRTDNPDNAKQILVIENNEELRTFIRKRLSNTYSVIEAGNGKEGLAAAKKHLPDLIISDVMMPHMDGYTFCKRVRKDPEIKFLPIILLTARAGKEDEIAGLKAGADEYVQKPFDTKVLKARVDNLIKLRLSLSEQFQQEGLPHVNDISTKENNFQQKIDEILNDNLSDPDFSVKELAGKIGLSRRQLLRKCKNILGKPPTEYIRHSRLKAASRLLNNRALNISEVAYAVGFNNLSLFSRYFKERYGKSPSAYRKDLDI